MKIKNILTKDFLQDHFVLQGKSMRAIAEEIGCIEKTVSYWVKKHGLSHHAKTRKVANIAGRTFDRWTVLRQDSSNSRGQAMWVCQCQCGKVKSVLGTSLLQGKSKSCGCLSTDLFFKGHEQISGSYWQRLEKGASLRSHEFTITIEYAWNLFLEQNGKCALTGLDLTFQKNYSNHAQNQTASLDRIDQNKGYVIGNVRWVHKDINRMRWAHDDKTFFDYCKMVVDHYENQHGKTTS